MGKHQRLSNSNVEKANNVKSFAPAFGLYGVLFAALCDKGLSNIKFRDLNSREEVVSDLFMSHQKYQ